MTSIQILMLAGGVSQLVGVVVTIVGAVSTWNQYSPDEHLFEPVVRATKTAIQSLWLRLRTLIGRPVPARMRSTRGGAAVRFGGSGRATVGFGPLSDDLTAEQAVAELDTRLRRVKDELEKLGIELSKYREKSDGELRRLERDLQTHVNQLTQQTRHVAVGGIRKIILGLALVGVGVLLQTWTAFIPA